MRRQFRGFRLFFIQMSNHTINSWKKFCLHHHHVVEDLRNRAIGNAERRTAPDDMDTTGARTSELSGSGSGEETKTVAGEETVTVTGEATDTAAGGATGTVVGVTLPVPKQVSPHESRPPPPQREKVVGPKPVLVKAEALDDDQLDFAFAANILDGWNANEESDEALWKRMESMVCSLEFSVCGMLIRVAAAQLQCPVVGGVL